MKYYIPASSLNLDNILQSECISPQPFYERRKTGYDNFVVLPQLRGIKQIALFSYPVCFSINDPNQYNFPILIEVEDEEQLGNNSCHDCGNGVFLCNKTLYLTPYNCRIFFFSEKSYMISIINTRDNLSIKNYKDYRIYSSVAALGELKEMPPLSFTVNLTLNENRETIMDKERGLLYGYMLGDSLSLTPELAILKYLSQEIYNTIAGIKPYISKDNIPAALIERLKSQLEAYQKENPVEKDNIMAFNAKLEKDASRYDIKADNFKELIKSWGDATWQSLYKNVLTSCGRTTLPQAFELRSVEDYDCLLTQLEQNTTLCIAEYKKWLPAPSLSAIMIDSDRVVFANRPILTIVLNYIIENKLTQSELISRRAEICSEIVNLIKDYFINNLGYSNEQWNQDAHRHYALSLYRKIKDFSSTFSLNEAKVLKFGDEFLALTAFLLYGQSLDNCLKYIVANKLSDYSLTLALWGTVCGFNEMNRDSLSGLLNDSTYETVYEHLHKTRLYKAEFVDAMPNHVKNESKLNTADFLQIIMIAKKITSDSYTALKNFMDGEYVDIAVLENFHSKCDKQQQSQCETIKEIYNLISERPIKAELLKGYFLKKDWPVVARLLGISPVRQTGYRRQKSNHQKKGSSRPGSEENNSANLFCQGIESHADCKFSFNLQNIEMILKTIIEINPQLSGSAVAQIRQDLMWVLDSVHRRRKSDLESLENFRLKLISGKTERISKNGNNMEWKNQEYSPLDVDKTIETLKTHLL